MRIRVLPVLLLPPLAAACDFPTEPFSWETQWLIPATTVTIGVEQVLPAGISRAPGGGAFQVTLAEFGAGVSLLEACQTCVAFHGMTVAKPEIEFTLRGTGAMPAAVTRARLGAASVPVVISNTLTFDPIRPSATARGRIVAVARDADGRALGEAIVDGATAALPPGGSVAFHFPITATDARGPVEVEVRVESPAGDPVHIDVNGRLELRVGPAVLTVTEADVRIQAEPFESPVVEFVPGEVDEAIADRVQGAEVRLYVDNPLGLSGPIDVEITVSFGVIRRTLQLAPGQSVLTLQLTRSEVRHMLLSPTGQIMVRGTVSAPGGIATVRPEHTFGFTPEILITLLMEF
jgi:hypothetical protein